MIIRYDKSYEQQWDRFVLQESVNGNFLQTRNFLNYHKEGRFTDHSLVFLKGQEIAAVMPANESGEKREIVSHQGSTFGGIIVGERFASVTEFEWIFAELSAYLGREGISRITVRAPSRLYFRKDVQLGMLDYYYGLSGFRVQCEVGFFIKLANISEGFERQFSTLRRRKLRKGMANGLVFSRMESDEETAEFYEVLSDNMKKFGTVPVHSLDELLEFKNARLQGTVSFYGVRYRGELIAGSMVFDFNDGKVFHTQYLASRQDRLVLCPNEFLYTELVREAKRLDYQYLSFGTATLEHGAVLNRQLALFKEGFHTDTYVNRTYVLDKNRR